MDIASQRQAETQLNSHTQATDGLSCFHCGLPVPKDSRESLIIMGEPRFFCCHGCMAVADLIESQGLTDYYQYRTEMPEPAESSDLLVDWAHYDDPEIQQQYVFTDEKGRHSIRLLSEHIRCSACAWLLEQTLGELSGIEAVQVHVTEQMLQIRWQQKQIPLSEILQKLQQLGYAATPFQEDMLLALQNRQQRGWLRRLGLAGLGMMQVMMYAVALYLGAFADESTGYGTFLRWVSFVVATPVLLYSAQPFYSSAFASLKQGQLNMDVPITLALFLAYFASVWSTLNHAEHVYFDSVTMFVFFLLLGRYLEFRVRQKVTQKVNLQAQQMPDFVHVLETKESHKSQPTLLQKVRVGDFVLIKSGELIAVDGVVQKGVSEVNESMLNGEFMPVAKDVDDTVLAGSVNGAEPLVVEVLHDFSHSYWSQLLALQKQAFHKKPKMAVIADTVAGYFVLSVLLIATVVATYWWLQSPADALHITLAVLVVSCPCALSLATPVALTCGSLALNQKNILIKSGGLIERLPKITDIVFDKTGTLTLGQLQVDKIKTFVDTEEQTVLSIIAALEAQSSHPIAKAFSEYQNAEIIAEKLTQQASAGVSGWIGEKQYWFGKPEFMPHSVDDNNGLWLSDSKQLLAKIELKDRLRDYAEELSQGLRKQGYQLHLLSGDPSDQVQQTAEQLAFSSWVKGAHPDEKINFIQQLQAQEKSVLMVGDGINDAPVMAAADASLAMAGASDLTRISADAYLFSGRLKDVLQMLKKSNQTVSVIKQNLAWALIYNLSMIPLAAIGLIPPYLAALGMSLSSVVVVLNSLRLKRQSDSSPNQPKFSPKTT